MSDDASKTGREPKPSPINGPAFLAFGILFVAFGVGSEMTVLFWPGLVILVIGLIGTFLQRRHDKFFGIEETLPGRPPSHSGDSAAEASDPAAVKTDNGAEN